MMHNKLLPSLLSLILIVGLGWGAEGIVAGKLQSTPLPSEDVPIELTPKSYQSGDTLLYEDYDEEWGPYGDNPPPGWTIIANGGDSLWNENDWHRYYWNGSYTARLSCSPPDTAEDILMSPVINCSSYYDIKLQCFTYYDEFGGPYTAVIEGSTDGGLTWPYIIREYSGPIYYGYETFNIDWADGQADVRIRWRGEGSIYNIFYWIVENILVIGKLLTANDVGVTKIISPPVKPFWPWGDTLYPVCEVANYGTEPQTSVLVRCRMWDTLTHSIAYDEVETVGPLEPMQKCTVYFTPLLPPPLEEHFYIDTMRTELDGDENPANDAKRMTHKITEWGSVWMKNHDDSLEAYISWILPNGEWAARFPQTPSPNLHINWVGVWVGSYANNTYPGQMIVYGWTGSAPKSEPIAVEDVTIQTVPLPNFYHNIFELECTVPDSPFVVSYKQLSVSPDYPFCGMDSTEPIDDNDNWLRHPTYTGNTWHRLRDYSPYHCDLSLEAVYEGMVIDAELPGFHYPDTVNSDTVISFAVCVKNAGLAPRNNIKVDMFFIHDSGGSGYKPGETLFGLEGNTGQINAGETKTITFPDTWRTKPGKYTIAGYTELLYDKNYENDSCQKVIFIRRAPGVMEGKDEMERFWFTLLPNPLTKGYGVLSYSVPQAGKAWLRVYDVTGRNVLDYSFIAYGTEKRRIDLRKLPAGIYLVRFSNNGQNAIQKLVIR